MKTLKFLSLMLLPIIIGSSCSVVFTGSITGTIVDKEAYEEDEANPEIVEANVFLYTDEDAWNEDFELWDNGEGSLPNDEDRENYEYFQSTVTNTDGDFTFSGFIWDSYFSEYGKTGDRKQIYLMFYHKKYGLMQNEVPIFVVSNVTNRIDLIKLTDQLNTQTISGNVFDYDSYDKDETDQDLRDNASLQGVSVELYVPEEWDYDASGAIDESSLVFSNEPTESVLTGETGDYSFDVYYWMKPNREDNKGTTKVLLKYILDGFTADPDKETDFSTTIDLNNNGETYSDGDLEDIYYLTDTISADSIESNSKILNDIVLVESDHSATIRGNVNNLNTGEGEAGVAVSIYVPLRFTSVEPADRTNYFYLAEDGGYYEFSSTADYNLQTDGNGDYEQAISFPFLPDSANDDGKTRIIVTYDKNTFNVDSTVDADINTLVDIDGDTTDDPCFFTDQFTKNTIETLSTIDIQQTEFTESLTGRIIDSATGDGLNGKTIKVYLGYSSDPDSDGDGDPAADYTSRSKTLTPEGATSQEAGHFEFDTIDWSADTPTAGYSGKQGTVEAWIKVLNDNDSLFNEQKVTLYAPSDNNLEIDG